MIAKRILCISSALLACSLGLAQGIDDNFTGLRAGSALPEQSASGWRQVLQPDGSGAAAGSAVVQKAEDSARGQFLRLNQRQTYVAREAAKPLWKIADGPVDFRIDFRLEGVMPVDFMLHNGRTSAGVKVVIDVDKRLLSVSESGDESVARAKMKSLPLDSFRLGQWYTMEIRGMELNGMVGKPVEGRLYLYESDSPARVLLDGVAIESTGNMPFNEINSIMVRRWGNSKDAFDIDSIVLEKP